MTRSFALVLLGALFARPLASQGAQHVLLVTGLSGDTMYARRFAEAARMVHDSATSRWGVPDSAVTWLAESVASDARRIRGQATREQIGAAFEAIARRARPNDLVLVVLIGHGSGEGEQSKLSLPGPDPVASDYARWLGRLQGQRVVMIVASSGSGDFLPVLSGRGRVVITATRSATERNESQFAEMIAAALTADAADADKDGKTTVLEAYQFARGGVERWYTSRSIMLTEHAQLDDNGDGTASADPRGTDGADGAVASTLAFGRITDGSDDPRVAQLMTERTALEGEVVALRARKTGMAATAYEAELERVLIQIALRSREIRSLRGADK